jgi:hypothetical protein
MEQNTEIVEMASELAGSSKTMTVSVAAVGTLAVAALVIAGIFRHRAKKNKELNTESPEKE